MKAFTEHALKTSTEDLQLSIYEVAPEKITVNVFLHGEEVGYLALARGGRRYFKELPAALSTVGRINKPLIWLLYGGREWVMQEAR